MVRVSEEEAIRLGIVSSKRNKPSKRKYNNIKCEYNGLKFDSQKERDFYLILLDRQRKGEIRELKRQVKFEIQPKFYTLDGKLVREVTYVADFQYTDVKTGLRHIIDVKGGKATQTPVYKLKKKLLAYKGIYIEEV